MLYQSTVVYMLDVLPNSTVKSVNELSQYSGTVGCRPVCCNLEQIGDVQYNSGGCCTHARCMAGFGPE